MFNICRAIQLNYFEGLCAVFLQTRKELFSPKARVYDWLSEKVFIETISESHETEIQLLQL